MEIQTNISLKAYNTFGIKVLANRFIEINSEENLRNILKKEKDIFVLSGGSNLLLTKNIDRLVLYINNKGIDIVKENKKTIDIAVNAGENWHEFVLWCIENDYGGIENLALIPGKVGTSPIQNIGAYGVEVKDVIKEVYAVNRSTGEKIVFKNKDCQFDYRNSIFKNSEKDKYIITKVIFRLTRTDHKLNYSYGAIKEKLNEKGINNPTIGDIANAVISIRQQKLPDPKEIGNSGSFFKNPIVSKTIFEAIYNLYPKNAVLQSRKICQNSRWLVN